MKSEAEAIVTPLLAFLRLNEMEDGNVYGNDYLSRHYPALVEAAKTVNIRCILDCDDGVRRRRSYRPCSLSETLRKHMLQFQKLLALGGYSNLESVHIEVYVEWEYDYERDGRKNWWNPSRPNAVRQCIHRSLQSRADGQDLLSSIIELSKDHRFTSINVLKHKTLPIFFDASSSSMVECYSFRDAEENRLLARPWLEWDAVRGWRDAGPSATFDDTKGGKSEDSVELGGDKTVISTEAIITRHWNDGDGELARPNVAGAACGLQKLDIPIRRGISHQQGFGW